MDDVDYSKWAEKELKVSEIWLDPKNVRLEVEDPTQVNLITDLFFNEDVLTIIESISEIGWYPGEPPIIVEEKGQYIVVEGNRRLAALKAIINPEIIPYEYSDYSKVKNLVEKVDFGEKIKVLIAPSRESTGPYVASKHTISTKRPWSTLGQAAFYYNKRDEGLTIKDLIRRYPHHDIPKKIKTYEMYLLVSSLSNNLSETTSKQLKKMKRRDFPITTLMRLEPILSGLLKVRFDSNTGEIKVPNNEEFYAVFAQIVEDIVAKKITSRKGISTKGDAEKYLISILGDKEISDEETIKVSDLSSEIAKVPEEFSEHSADSDLSQETASQKDRSSSTVDVEEESIKKPKGRDRLFRRLTLPPSLDKSPVLRSRLEELNKIWYWDYPYMTLDALRSFLEVILKKYLEDIGKQAYLKSNKAYLSSALDKLQDVEKECGRNIIQAIEQIKEIDKDILDSVNHNPFVIAERSRVEACAERIEELLNHLFTAHAESIKGPNDDHA